ncbi:hypothetical protein HG15A2_13610 [Adhaeretor mobilis]|uniref:Uncharacterized protein n=2 Tax=Adhaeretor mobilis TaxID=1930276 RepID=A0A517MT83_9BACT|nr:hypothetical protein HG15A2_13610 [Adhaeretor mobilis]
MGIPERDWLIFKSGLFLYHQPDDQIDQWFVGGDCAGWLYARLLPQPNIRAGTSPVMEDWGWYSALRTFDLNVRVALLTYPWPEQEHCWAIGLEPKRKFFLRSSNSKFQQAVTCIADGLDAIVEADERFEHLGWFAQDPFLTAARH